MHGLCLQVFKSGRGVAPSQATSGIKPLTPPAKWKDSRKKCSSSRALGRCLQDSGHLWAGCQLCKRLEAKGAPSCF